MLALTNFSLHFYAVLNKQAFRQSTNWENSAVNVEIVWDLKHTAQKFLTLHIVKLHISLKFSRDSIHDKILHLKTSAIYASGIA